MASAWYYYCSRIAHGIGHGKLILLILYQGTIVYVHALLAFFRSNWLVLRPGVWLATKLAKVGMSLVMGMLVQYAICKGFVPKAYGLGGYIERAMILVGASALRL